MQRTLLADFKGLVTAPGLLMRAEASFTVATNALFDAPGLVRKRPGFQLQASNPTLGAFKLHTSPILAARVLAHVGGPTGLEMNIGDGVGAWLGIANIDVQPIARTDPAIPQRMGLLGRSHYLTSDSGLRRLEQNLTEVRFAGMPRGTPPNTNNMDAGAFGNVLTAANPWLPNGAAVAYRVTWHRLDDSGVELGGPPTGRVTIRNIATTSGHTGASRSTNLGIQIPFEFGTNSTDVTDTYFCRLWRTRDFLTTEPDDEMALVAQRAVTAGDIGFGYVVISDFTPSSLLRGAPKLHTNPNDFPDGAANIEQGPGLNADDPPPSANCVAQWRGCLWAADNITPEASLIQLVALLVNGDVVSLDGVNTLTAVGGVPSGAQFTNVTGLATLALNLEATARNIVERHNIVHRTASESVAYYTSVGTQSPGLITVIAKAIGTVLSVGTCPLRPASWRFGTPSRSGGRNELRYSRAGRGDAMPLVNTLTVGTAQTTILQIVPYRDFMLVFSDGGIYAVTGATWADFNVQPFDLTFRLAGRELVAEADDRVYAWCREGVVEIDEGGCTVISTPIEPTLQAIVTGNNFGTAEQNLTALANFGFAVGYRIDHRVLFFYQQNYLMGDGGCLDALIFDTRTRAWSKLNFDTKTPILPANVYKKCAAVRFSDDRLLLGWRDSTGGFVPGRVWEERRTQTNADYEDDDASGEARNVVLSLALQAQTPDSGGAVHWQSTIVYFETLDGNPFVARVPPPTFVVTYSTEWGSSGVLVTTGGSTIVRVQPPASMQRGNRFTILLTEGGVNACGFVGISQTYRAGTSFPRRT